MRILVSGASGLVGGALVTALRAEGHEVLALRRGATAPTGTEIPWDSGGRGIDPALLSGVDAVVHLAGENIAAGRWTDARKAAIRDSRVRGTAEVASAVALARPKPAVLVVASAIGIYGNRADEVLDESSGPAADFLALVCKEWEAAAEPARAAGIRVVHLRFGVVLSRQGGALARMLLPFKLGLGGRIGSGHQWMSWIGLDDAVAAIRHALATSSLVGPVNAVAPTPVTNGEFTKALGRALRRPTLFPMPAFAARLAFGEVADALLLASTRVVPRRLESSGFRFATPNLDAALARALA